VTILGDNAFHSNEVQSSNIFEIEMATSKWKTAVDRPKIKYVLPCRWSPPIAQIQISV